MAAMKLKWQILQNRLCMTVIKLSKLAGHIGCYQKEKINEKSITQVFVSYWLTLSELIHWT